ncbi:MAG: hypothetical protein IKB23_03155 [Clostridia bacterium]|nr:hypothetical protein [Clostridia bacterium]
MEDFERYSDYNEYEDDEPKKKGPLGLILKILTAVVCLLVVGVLAFRLYIFNNYPSGMEKLYFNDKLTEYYNSTGGEIGALTQNLRAEYDDPDEGNFFCDNLIVIPGINQLQISVRYNVSLMKSIEEKYGVSLVAGSEDNFTFRLAVMPLSKGDGTAIETGTLSEIKSDKMFMYRYHKLVFDDVDLSLEGEDEIWIRLEILINGVEMEEPYMVLVYEDTETSEFKDYKLSKGERPQ